MPADASACNTTKIEKHAQQESEKRRRLGKKRRYQRLVAK